MSRPLIQLKIILSCCLFVTLTQFISLGISQEYVICKEANKATPVSVFQGDNGWLFHPGDLAENSNLQTESLEQLARLKKAFDYKDIQVLVAPIPTRAMFHNSEFDLNQKLFADYDNVQAEESYHGLIEQLNQLGFIAPNLLDGIRDNGSPDSFSFVTDSHWSTIGASDSAKIIAQTIQSLEVFEEINLINFDLLEANQRDRPTDLARYAMRVCSGLTIPTEVEKVYDLVNSAEGVDLFTGSDVPQLVIWGTSYSNSSSFSKFLQYYSSAEASNYAVGAGGSWSSLMEYFLSTDFDDNAKIALWEFPLRYVDYYMNSVDDYREVIPTVYGACSDDQMINQSNLVVISENSSRLPESVEFSNWTPDGLSLVSNQIDPEGSKEAIKLIFKGQKDPKLKFEINTGRILAGQTITQSVWLWTDADQPKNAAIYLHSLPKATDVSRKLITLTTTPTLYKLEYTFQDDQQTAFQMRIDGLEGNSVEEAQQLAGSYLYAFAPELRSPFSSMTETTTTENNVTKSNLLLIENEESIVQGNNYYAHVDLSDLAVLDFKLILNYHNGKMENIDVSRSSYMRNNGQFFMELSDSIESPLKSVVVNLPNEAIGTVQASICRAP